MNRTMHRTASQRGFSLAEVITATAIFAIIFIAALMMYDRSNRVYKQGVEAADMQQSTRVAFDRLVADLRMTGFDYDRDGAPSSSLASTWQPNAPYSIGNMVEPDPPNGYVYRASQGGQSAGTAPAWNTAAGSQTNENAPSTVIWALASDVQYQQPDEQVEFAGTSIIGIRGNFDYEMELGPCGGVAGTPCENGRETAYESDAFPVVTTGNDEIVIYALRPVNPPVGAFAQQTFFADMSRPRDVHIGSGAKEDQVNLPTVYDPCTGGCNNPPYTLYRITFRDANGANFVETPVAENIRSVSYRYFRDVAATDEITTLPLGAGQWDGAAPNTTIAERDERAEIRAIRINLTGMNPQPDGSYTDPTDAIAPKNRKYQLETLVVPRNIGRHGMKEFASGPPTAPTLDIVCAGSCNAVYVGWTAPTNGDVESYNILYDTDDCTSGFTFAEDAGRNLDGYAANWITPGQTYYFAVQAINKHGATTSNCMSAAVVNTTRPDPPGNLEATGDGTRPSEENQVTLYWPKVETNDDTKKTVPCSNATVRDTKNIPAPERIFYRVYKSTNPAVIPGAAGTTEVLNELSATSPMFDGTNMVWTDTATANCTAYYYRVRTVDFCYRNAAYNQGNDITIGASNEYFPPLASQGIKGESIEIVTAPAAPTGVAVTSDSCTAGLCDVTLSWSPVTRNDGQPVAPPITIDKYVVTTEVKDPGGLWPGQPGYLGPPAVDTTFTGGVLTGTVSNVVQGLEYRFFVRAEDCIPGIKSAAAFYPCVFNGGTITIAPGVAYGGSGVSGDPWVTENPATIEVGTQNPVGKIEATVFQGGMPVGSSFVLNGPTSAASIALPDIVDGVEARVAITITDATSGCVLSYDKYVIDQPAPQCSLTAPSIMSHNDVTVTFPITNSATGPTITVRKVLFNWTSRPNVNNAADQLTTVDFGPGGSVSPACGLGTTFVTVPTPFVLAPGGTQVVTVTFRRAKFNKAITANPISGICVTYQVATGDVLRCTIVPGSGTCTDPATPCQ